MLRALFLASLLLLPGVVFAAPAGSLIEALASATYLDAANQTRTTTSNMVVTVVQQVFGVAVSPAARPDEPGQTRTGIPGGSVDFPYTVTNTGNGTDSYGLEVVKVPAGSFLASSIVEDRNCNGRRDSGEVVITSLTLTASGSACVVISATIAAATAPDSTEDLGLKVESDGDDDISREGAKSRVIVVDSAIISAFLSASPVSSVSAGGEIRFTLSGSNIGSANAYATATPEEIDAADGILVTVDVPAGLSLTDAEFSVGAGTGTLFYFDGTAWSATVGAGVEKIALLLGGDGGFFVQGASYELTYTLVVPGDAGEATAEGGPLAGHSYESVGSVTYATGGDGAGETKTESNTVRHVVGPAYHAFVGPYGLTTGTYLLDGRTVSRAADTQSIALAYAGNRVSFRNTLRNDSNVAASFALEVSGVPSGWSCGVYAADGATPVSTAGPIAPLATTELMMRCQIPAAGATAPASVVLTASVVGHPTASDTTTNTITDVSSGYGATFLGDPMTVAADAGSSVTFELNIENGGHNADSFSLSVPENEFGAGSSVAFYRGCGANLSSTPISSTGLLGAGEEICVTAVVSVPANATSAAEFHGNREVTFEVKSAGDTSVTANLTHEVAVNHRAGASFGPNRTGTATSPGLIVSDHVLRNSGNTTATASLPAVGGVCAGCTVQYSVGEGAPYSTTWSGSLAPGAELPVTMRLMVPSGEPIGRRLTVSATATMNYGALGALSHALVNTVDVVGGELSLKLAAKTCGDPGCDEELSADAATAEPSDYVVYDITAVNIGTAGLRQVVITDPLPAFTRFVSVSATASFTGTILYSADGTSWSTVPVAELATGQSLYVGVDLNDDGVIGAEDSIPVAGNVTIRLVTQVE